MRHYLKFFIAALVLCSFYAFRADHLTEPPSGLAFYRFIHIRDTTNIGRVWTEDFLLAFNTKQSMYSSYTKRTQDSMHQAKIEEAIKSGSTNINLGLLLPTTGDNIYMLQNEQSLYVNKNFNQNSYLIKETLENINWKIDKETKKILGYTCQKAEGLCKGRTYTAWFSTDIPASFGPWKLHGLPGLILEAYDSSQRIQFSCTKIVFDGSVSSSGMALELPAEAIATSYSAFDRMEKAYREGAAIDANRGADLQIEKVTVNGAGQGVASKKLILNNPLELTPQTK